FFFDEASPSAIYTLSLHDALPICTDALFGPEYASSKLTLLPGYEHSLGGGHAGVFVPDKSVFLAADGTHTVLTDTDGSTSFNGEDRKSTRLNSSHRTISYAVFCLK